MDFTNSISFPKESLISWTFLDHFCHHFLVGATANSPKIVVKNGQEMFNWSEIHSEKKYYLWNWNFSTLLNPIPLGCWYILIYGQILPSAYRNRVKSFKVCLKWLHKDFDHVMHSQSFWDLGFIFLLFFFLSLK